MSRGKGHNQPHAAPQLASPPTPLQGERGVKCLACVVQKHGLGESTRCFVMALQDVCTDTTRCLYGHYKALSSASTRCLVLMCCCA